MTSELKQQALLPQKKKKISHPRCVRKLHFLSWLNRERTEFINHLAAHRAESEGVRETSATNLTSVGHSLPKPRLWPLIEEHHLRTVDDVCLNVRDVDVFLNLAHPHHIVVGRYPYLQAPENQTKPDRSAIKVKTFTHKNQNFDHISIRTLQLSLHPKKKGSFS